MSNNKTKMNVTITKEIYSNEDGNYFIYAGFYYDKNGTYNEISVTTDGFQLRPGKTLLVGTMGKYRGTDSFKADYEDFDEKSYDSKYNLLCSIDGIKGITAKKILDTIPNNDLEIFYGNDFPKIPRIGPKTIEKIHKGLNFLRNNKKLKELIAMLGQNVSNKKIHEVNKYLLDNKIEIDSFKVDPYTILIDNIGIPFKKVDHLAQTKLNCDKYLKSRILFLTEQIVKAITGFGHTYTNIEDFTNKVKDLNLNPNNINYLISDKDSKVVSENNIIQTKAMFEAEKNIPLILKTFLDAPGITNYELHEVNILIKKFERENNFILHEKQRDAIIESIKNNVSLITGGGGCVDCDTEFFNGFKWEKISEYKLGEKVLQYNEDGTSSLIIPKDYIKLECDNMWYFKTNYGIDQCLSDEHNVYYITSKNNLYHKKFKEIREKHKNTNGFKGRFITTFNYSGDGLNYNEWEIRLKIAIKADGHIENNNTKAYRVQFKKIRKIERFRMLLIKNNVKFKEKNNNEGYTVFRFYHNTSKNFNKHWYNCTLEQFKIIYDEIFNWDGYYKNKNRWTTTIKKDADFMQFVGSVCGYRSYISTRDRVGKKYITSNKEYIRKSIEYTVNFTKRTLIGLTTERKNKNQTKTPINNYKTKDGFKYCFETYSGMLVLRRNNKIFITGNTGKTTIMKCIIYILEKLNNSVVCTSPTGKASRRMSQATEHKAYTCHRFYYSEDSAIATNNPTEWASTKPTTMIIDEFSMVDTQLFYNILNSMVKSENTFTRLILVGDPGQLPSVGAGSVMADIIKSQKITNTKLENTFRNSGYILNFANKIRNNEVFPPIKEKDFFVNFPSDLNGYILRCFDHQKEIYKNDIDKFYNDFQICTSSRKRSNEINKMIQLSTGNTKFMIRKTPLDFGIGDKVMCIKNDYNNDVYNGEFGRVISLTYRTKSMSSFESDIEIISPEILKDLYKQELFIKDVKFNIYYEGLNKTISYDLDFDEIENFQLAYCTTIHKLQGSEFKTVIVDCSEFNMITDSRLLYTAVTRAKEKLILLSDNNQTINKITLNKLSSKRNTLLYNKIIESFKIENTKEKTM